MDYSNLLEHDFVLGKEGSGKASEYSLRPVPQKKGSEKATKAAWDDALEAGFDNKEAMCIAAQLSMKTSDNSTILRLLLEHGLDKRIII